MKRTPGIRGVTWENQNSTNPVIHDMIQDHFSGSDLSLGLDQREVILFTYFTLFYTVEGPLFYLPSSVPRKYLGVLAVNSP